MCCSKISNELIVLGYYISMIYQCMYRKNSVVWVTGVSVPVLILFLLFAFKMIGAGDIKVLSVIGGFYNWSVCLKIFLIALLYGAVWSFLKIVLYGNIKERFLYFLQFCFKCLTKRKRLSYRDGLNKRDTIPFCVPILLAYLSFLAGGAS
jgi:Flp pilus assembly protein protease CpaA